MWWGGFRGCGRAGRPGGRAGVVGSGSWVGPGWPGWLGQCGEFPEAGEDFGEQVVAGRWSQDWLPCLENEAGGDADQPVPQSGDHGFAVAGAPPGELAGGGIFGGGELMEPGGHGCGQQGTPHPGGVHLDITGGEVAQRGAVFAVAEDVLDAGAVSVPVLNLDG